MAVTLVSVNGDIRTQNNPWWLGPVDVSTESSPQSEVKALPKTEGTDDKAGRRDGEELSPTKILFKDTEIGTNNSKAAPSAADGEPATEAAPAEVFAEPAMQETPTEVAAEPAMQETPAEVAAEPAMQETPAEFVAEPADEIIPSEVLIPQENNASDPLAESMENTSNIGEALKESEDDVVLIDHLSSEDGDTEEVNMEMPAEDTDNEAPQSHSRYEWKDSVQKTKKWFLSSFSWKNKDDDKLKSSSGGEGDMGKSTIFYVIHPPKKNHRRE